MQIEYMTELATSTLHDLKGQNIVTIDVKGITSIADAVIICTGTSSRHVKSLATKVAQTFKDYKNPALGIEGDDNGEWVLVDLGDLVIHVMQKSSREFYDLEGLWSKAHSNEEKQTA